MMPALRDKEKLYEELSSATGVDFVRAMGELAEALTEYGGKICWLRLHERRPDVVNDAVWEAIRGRSSFRGESTFTTWFTRILIHKCQDELRRKQRASREVSIEAMGDEDFAELSTQASPEEHVALVRMLEGLEPVERELVVLRGMDWDWAHIGAELGIEESTARKRWSRLLARLRGQ